jgi:hypothetical protein
LLLAAAGTVPAFLIDPADVQIVPSKTFNKLTPVLLSYHSCPSTGLLGAVLFAKFSNKCKKLFAISGAYPA